MLKHFFTQTGKHAIALPSRYSSSRACTIINNSSDFAGIASNPAFDLRGRWYNPCYLNSNYIWNNGLRLNVYDRPRNISTHPGDVEPSSSETVNTTTTAETQADAKTKVHEINIQVDRSGLRSIAVEPSGPPVEKPPMTPMIQHLRELIEFLDRPLTIAEYMKEVLTHPEFGFYMRRDVFGAEGDFVTSPEISQVFGEMIGIWVVVAWQQLGKPSRLHLVELGPGRGTLMADLLRSTACFAEFTSAVEVHMVEVSPALRRMQWDKLQCQGDGPSSEMEASEVNDGSESSQNSAESASEPSARVLKADGTEYQPESFGDIRIGSLGSAEQLTQEHSKLKAVSGASSLNGSQVTWHRSLSEIPEGPMVLIAHELFDALPVHQLQKTDLGWCERVIDIAKDDQPEHFQLMLAKGPALISNVMKNARLRNTHPQDAVDLKHLELCPDAWTLAQDIARRLEQHSGAALVVDYGHQGPTGDTLQAIRQHAFTPLLDDPGSADLSTYVDFGAVQQAVLEINGEVDVTEVATQSTLLHSLGIQARFQALAQGADDAEIQKLMTQYQRLVGVGEISTESGEVFHGMGESYKAVAMMSKGVGVLPGFTSHVSNEDNRPGES